MVRHIFESQTFFACKMDDVSQIYVLGKWQVLFINCVVLENMMIQMLNSGYLTSSQNMSITKLVIGYFQMFVLLS